MKIEFLEDIDSEYIIEFKITLENFEDDLFEEAISLDGDKYEQFITNLTLAMVQRGYELFDQEDSPVSDSKYYFFKKVENNITLKAVVEVRVSDHGLQDKNGKSGFMQAVGYLHSKAKKLSKSRYNNSKDYEVYLITVNSKRYSDYWNALNDITNDVDSFERTKL